LVIWKNPDNINIDATGEFQFERIFDVTAENQVQKRLFSHSGYFLN